MFFSCKSSRSASQPQNQYTAVQQQRYHARSASSFRLCASSHDVCVWLVHSSRRSNHDSISWYMINTYNATVVIQPSSDVIPGKRNKQQQQKQCCVAHTTFDSFFIVQIIGTCSPFRLATPPGYEVNPIPNEYLVHIYIMRYTRIIQQSELYV